MSVRIWLKGVIPDEKATAALESDESLQVETDPSRAVGTLYEGIRRWDSQCRASSDHSFLHSSFLRSSPASFSRLSLHPSLKTPAAVGGEREGGKGGGGGRGWGRKVCQSFHPPVAIHLPLLPLIQHFVFLLLFILGRYFPTWSETHIIEALPLLITYNKPFSLYRPPVWTL